MAASAVIAEGTAHNGHLANTRKLDWCYRSALGEGSSAEGACTCPGCDSEAPCAALVQHCLWPRDYSSSFIDTVPRGL
jgi:hypothetical protein